MAELLLINPRRRKARKTASKRRVTRRRIVRAANPAPRRRRAARRHNPIGTIRRTVMRRARRVRAGRRRNPISMGLSSTGIINALKDAAVGGAGAIAVEAIMGQLSSHLPTSLQRDATGGLGAYDAVKAGITIALGTLLKKSTKGLSMKMAAGALTVQAAEAMRRFVPDTMTLGYAGVTPVVRGRSMVGPNSNALMHARGNRFVPGTSTLSYYPGDAGRDTSPMLSGMPNDMRSRERATW